jgi:alcohol dehydrogenase class IV
MSGKSQQTGSRAGTVDDFALSKFRWEDGERVVRFGRGTRAEAPGMLHRPYVLLTTPRAAACAPDLVAGAGRVHHVPPGLVDELAAGLREQVDGEWLVALGGGRVVDTAKALAAAAPPRRVAAIPTTLSGAEMTGFHRHVTGVDPATPGVRPALVICDPALSASLPDAPLAGSASNALGHTIEAPVTALANPVATLAAYEGARAIVAGFEPTVINRDRLGFGALLSGYALGSSAYGLHHVICQELVRHTSLHQGMTYAIMLPQTLRALARRFPHAVARMEQALGRDLSAVAADLHARTGMSGLDELGVTSEQLDRAADAAAAREQLALTPPAADRREIRELYSAAA